jgi:HSP20 family molecular chaperone IbpA
MADEVAVQEKQESEVAETTRPGRTYIPSVDISESEEALWLWADVPGVDENSVDLRLENNQLTIEGRVSLDEYEGASPVYTEYPVGNFARTFRVSDAIDANRIRATVKDGVLELELPKSEAAQPRRIAVTAG